MITAGRDRPGHPVLLIPTYSSGPGKVKDDSRHFLNLKVSGVFKGCDWSLSNGQRK